MIFKEDYNYIGKTLKTHGFKGELLVFLENFKREGFQIKEYIFLEIDGIYVPFFIDYIENQENGKAIVKLEDIDTDFNALKFTGLKVFLPYEYKKRKKDEFNLSQLKGYRIKDAISGFNGKIEGILDIPGNPLLRVIIKNNKEILIPFNKDLIQEISQKENILVMKLPEGLTE